MKDTGSREGFDTGSVRDSQAGKPRPDLASPFAAERLGAWLARGAEKYAVRNWEKGQPISRCIASLERHLMAYKQGRTDEDHAAAIMCNAMFILHYEEGIRAGFLPAELDDMPHYLGLADGGPADGGPADSGPADGGSTPAARANKHPRLSAPTGYVRLP